MGNIGRSIGNDGNVNYPITLAECVVLGKKCKLSDILRFESDDSGEDILITIDMGGGMGVRTFSFKNIIMFLISMGAQPSDICV